MGIVVLRGRQRDAPALSPTRRARWDDLAKEGGADDDAKAGVLKAAKRYHDHVTLERSATLNREAKRILTAMAPCRARRETTSR